jgi:hypothetical protein
LQYLRADTFGGLIHCVFGDVKDSVGVVRRELSAQFQPAPWNESNTTPLLIANLEHPRHDFLRGAIPFPHHGAGVLVFHLGAAILKLGH